LVIAKARVRNLSSTADLFMFGGICAPGGKKGKATHACGAVACGNILYAPWLYFWLHLVAELGYVYQYAWRLFRLDLSGEKREICLELFGSHLRGHFLPVGADDPRLLIPENPQVLALVQCFKFHGSLRLSAWLVSSPSKLELHRSHLA